MGIRKFIAIFGLVVIWNCHSNELSRYKGSLASENLQEDAVLDFYGSESQKEHALNLLQSACSSSQSYAALSCYNLAVLYLQMNQSDKANEYANRAHELEPKDTLYNDIVFQVKQVQEMNSAEASVDLQKELAIIIKQCKTKENSKATLGLQHLADQGFLEPGMLENGVLAHCNTKPIQFSKSKGEFDYSREYLLQKERSHPLYPVLEVSSGVEGARSQLASAKAKRLSSVWENILAEARRGNQTKARIYLSEFLNLLKHPSTKEEKDLYPVIWEASRILIETDPHFRRVRSLGSGFPDTLQ